MPAKQTPLISPRGMDPHNFKLKAIDWEAAVFDSAACFAVVRMRGLHGRCRDEFPSARAAIEFARAVPSEGPCVYAVTAQGRSALLEPGCWDDWIRRAEGGELCDSSS